MGVAACLHISLVMAEPASTLPSCAECLALVLLAGCGAQADMVTHITFVDGRGEIHTVDRHCLEGRGLTGGLGLLGVITEVTIRVRQGLLKTHLWAVGPKNDTNIEQELTDLIVSGARGPGWQHVLLTNVLRSHCLPQGLCVHGVSGAAVMAIPRVVF